MNTKKLRLFIEIWLKVTLTFFAPNQVVTISKSQSFFSRLILLSKDLIVIDAIFLHMAESSFTIIRQRGIKNIPQFSWSSPWKKTGTYEHTQTRILRGPNKGGPWAPKGSRETRLTICFCDSRYLRKCVKEISDHFQDRLSPSLMFITRARTLEGLVSIF